MKHISDSISTKSSLSILIKNRKKLNYYLVVKHGNLYSIKDVDNLLEMFEDTLS